jgi:hypothetical protein
MSSQGMFSHRPMLPALAPVLGRVSQSAIADAFSSLAERLDPDRPDLRNGGRVAIIRIRYDATETEPAEWGPEYAIVLPEKAPSAEAWYRHVQARFRDQLPPRPGETP